LDEYKADAEFFFKKLEEEQGRHQKAESQVQQQTSLLESCRKALVKAEARVAELEAAMREEHERLLALAAHDIVRHDCPQAWVDWHFELKKEAPRQ
jgi:hypothetical protein